MLAGAARCGGDSFCVPFAAHAANTAASVRTARREGIFGYVVTSWAVRRSPWPLTWYAFERAAFPDLPQEEFDRDFALRHFNAGDACLGELPALLGQASYEAGRTCGIIESYNEFSDYETGNFYGIPYDRPGMYWQARTAQTLSHPGEVAEKYEALRAALEDAKDRLALANPATEAQRYEVSLWYWAIEVLDYFCDVAFLMISPQADADKVRPLISRGQKLDADTTALLNRLYTDRTLEGASSTRFGVCLEWLNPKAAEANLA